MKVACVIPARLGSTRFPRKILALLGGKPLLQWVFEAALWANCFEKIYIAVDAQETYDLAKGFGACPVLTEVGCQNGTARLIELCEKGYLDHMDRVVNWQADEPFIDRAILDPFLRSVCQVQSDIWTVRKLIDSVEEYRSLSVVKVVSDKENYALYFSRASIPHTKEFKKNVFYKHIGLYAYSKDSLEKIAPLSKSVLDEHEDLEQLRFLYHKLQIHLTEVTSQVIGIDLPEDLKRAEGYLADRVLNSV